MERFVTIPNPPKKSQRDPRMKRSAAMIRGAMKKHSDKGAVVATINMTHGFRASAPDLGKLQSLMAPHFAGMSMAEIRAHRDEISRWAFDLLGEWVQRTKRLDVDCGKIDKDHVRIAFATKDDEGWYDYAFSIYVPPPRR